MTCEHILLTGNNKGNKCSKQHMNGSVYCKTHDSVHVERDSCSICLENILDNNNVILECNHKYHFSCIMNLSKQNGDFSNRCPLCRNEFTEKEEICQHFVINIPPEIDGEFEYFLRIINSMESP